MSKSDDKALKNAGKIIERFGGIRPMAAKIDTPVTTVQGWKKRDVIPSARREQILEAALDNNIDLSDLLSGAGIANENKEEVSAPRAVPQVAVENKVDAPQVSENIVSSSSASMKKEAVHDDLMAAIALNNRKTIAASAWTATILILVAVGAAVFLLWPNIQGDADHMKEQIEAQSEKITSLEDEVKQAGEKKSLFDNFVPDEIQDKIDSLQNQAQNIQNTVDQISVQTAQITSGVLGPDAGPLSARLQILEEKMTALAGSDTNFGDLIGRIKSLEGSVVGQQQLQGSVAELRAMVENAVPGQSLNSDLADAQSDEQGALSQTLEGVSGNDLKAAAMLIAFSQLRDSLHREAPFENDLALLRKLAGDDNPELNNALERLAPHADGGVLTASGLSSEFKGLAGDIVVSSLKGEDVSFTEKAKARLNSVLQVEKEGELITGTGTQATVAKAQKLLDEGNIQEAITELQSLDGEAAAKAQPFIDQAQVSLLAEKAQEMLGSTILSKISGQLPVSDVMGAIIPQGQSGSESAAGPLTENFNMDAVKENLENVVPLGESDVVRDEESGVTILPKQQGFKGFSSWQ